MRWLALIVALAGCDRVFGVDTVHGDAAAFDAPPRPDAPTGVCGEIGTPCCAGPAACGSGAACLGSGDASRCVDNAGVFGEQKLNPCGTTECDDDPYAGACACPSGFSSEQTDIDGGCGADLSNPMHAITKLTMCVAGGFPANTDWGDFFIRADIAACTPMPNGCYSPNHITHDCTCPAPTTAVPLRVFIPGVVNGTTCTNGYLGASLTLCLNPNVAPASVLGVYEQDPDTACRTSFPMGDCHCPAGALTSSIPVFTDRMVGPGVEFMRSTITLCLAPP